MIKKILFLILLFYLLALIQISFLVHLRTWGIVPNLILIAIIFINLFSSHFQWYGVGIAILGGFYLDIFSISGGGFFGFYTLISAALAFFIQFILKKYVRIPTIKRL